LSGVINKQLFSCPVFMAHNHIQPGIPFSIVPTVPTVLITVGVLFFVFLPQEGQRHVLSGLQFFVNLMEIWVKQGGVDAWGG
jgi:hypothetical protein